MSNLRYILKLQRDRKKWQQRSLILTTIISGVFVVFLFNLRHLSDSYTAISTKDYQTIQSLKKINEDTVSFYQQTANINYAPDCFPISLSSGVHFKTYYQFCSEAARQADSEETYITELFKVDSGIARRYNFWKRIYSIWGKNHFVVHAAEYPEVVFEILDASALKDTGINEIKFLKKVNKKLTTIKGDYKKLLYVLHKNRNKNPEDLSPTLKRIVDAMKHIEDPGKYYKAYKSIRSQRGQRSFIKSGLRTSSLYLPIIEEEFSKRGMPKELASIGFVESSYNLKAYSKVGAAGVYQIMPATAKQHMIVHSLIDERRDPIKSGVVAAKLLAQYHRITDSWALALTSYNHGVGSIKRAIRKTKSNDISYIIDNYTHASFGFASKNFYTSFLGMLYTIKNRHKIFPNVKDLEPLKYIEIKIKKPVRISSIARNHKTTKWELAKLNPDLARSLIKYDGMLPTGYKIKVGKYVEQVASN